MHIKPAYSDELSDQRKENRNDIVGVIEYTLNSLHENDTFDGVISNISKSGLCLLTTNFLNKDQKITIKNNKYNPNQSAIVRWSDRNSSLYCKVGLEFVC
jgi:hypothetical protein